MRNLKKALCGIMTGMMIITAAPAAIPGTGFVTEVQAATIGTPKMVSVKAVGKSTVAVKWSAVKGAAGYRAILMLLRFLNQSLLLLNFLIDFHSSDLIVDYGQ